MGNGAPTEDPSSHIKALLYLVTPSSKLRWYSTIAVQDLHLEVINSIHVSKMGLICLTDIETVNLVLEV